MPQPNTDDEKRLYRTLYRNLVRGLQREFGQPLPALWVNCLRDDNNIDADDFREVLDDLLNGPIANTQRTLVLAVDGLARMAKDHLQSWAYLMSSLAEHPDLALKLFVWGEQELHELCTGSESVMEFSPFHRLKVCKVEPFSQDEVAQRMQGTFGQTIGVEALYALTEGHPALV